MEVKNLFNNGDVVYVVSDECQFKRIIISIAKDWNGGIRYEAAIGTESNWFQAIELSTTRDVGMVTEKKAAEDE